MKDEKNVLDRQRGKIRARVLSVEKGLQELSGVTAIRIHSSDYTLLIMEDYTPTLGEIKGDMDILTQDGERHWDNINAFYMLQDNLFVVILKDTVPGEE